MKILLCNMSKDLLFFCCFFCISAKKILMAEGKFNIFTYFSRFEVNCSSLKTFDILHRWKEWKSCISMIPIIFTRFDFFFLLY